jgi:hypothetical protein
VHVVTGEYRSVSTISKLKITVCCHKFSATKSNSNSLANQLGIHIILAKREKLPFNSLANQLGKNRNLAKLTSPRAYMHRRFPVGGRVKKEIKNREGFLM